jgi:hypothetical protein
MRRSQVVLQFCWQTDEPIDGTPGTSAPTHGSYASAGSAFAVAVQHMGNATTRKHDTVRPFGQSGASPG